MVGAIKTFSTRKSRRGAIALEYALVLAFVAIGVLASLIGLGGDVTVTMGDLGGRVSAVSDQLDFK